MKSTHQGMSSDSSRPGSASSWTRSWRRPTASGRSSSRTSSRIQGRSPSCGNSASALSSKAALTTRPNGTSRPHGRRWPSCTANRPKHTCRQPARTSSTAISSSRWSRRRDEPESKTCCKSKCCSTSPKLSAGSREAQMGGQNSRRF